MKTKLTILLLGVFLATGLLAQPAMSVEKRAEMLSNRMQKELNLTEKQYQKVKEVNTTYIRKKRTLMQSRMRQDLKEKQLKVAKQTQNEAMKQILTKKQYEKYLEMDIRKPMRLRMKNQNRIQR